jgi:hypothetical protein
MGSAANRSTLGQGGDDDARSRHVECVRRAAFTDSRGSDKYEEVFVAVMEWLRADSHGAWRAWFDNDRYGDLGVTVIFRRTTRHPRTRVSMGPGFVDATRNVSTESYFGLNQRPC